MDYDAVITESGRKEMNPRESTINQSDSACVWRISGLTRDGTAEPLLRDQILRRERKQGKMHFPCSADHEQDW